LEAIAIISGVVSLEKHKLSAALRKPKSIERYGLHVARALPTQVQDHTLSLIHPPRSRSSIVEQPLPPHLRCEKHDRQRLHLLQTLLLLFYLKVTLLFPSAYVL